MFAAVNALMLDKHTLFIADTFVNDDPSAEELAEIAAMAVEEVLRFGVTPKVAFLSHSMYGSSKRASALKMRVARDLFVKRMPGLPPNIFIRDNAGNLIEFIEQPDLW